MNDFITVLAWIFGCGSTLLFTIRLWGWITVFNGLTENQLILVRMRMQENNRNMGLLMPLVIAIISWIWVITV